MRFLFFLCTCVLAQTIAAQELSRSVIGSAGTYSSANNSINLHWTLGEVAVDRTQNGLTLERGFHHGNYELLSTAIWTAPEVQLNITAFPNPTVNQVDLTGDWEVRDILVVHDLLGRQLLEQNLPPARARVTLGNYPAGTYLLSIVRQGRPLKTLRIIRK